MTLVIEHILVGMTELGLWKLHKILAPVGHRTTKFFVWFLR